MRIGAQAAAAPSRPILGSWVAIGLALLFAVLSMVPVGITADGAGIAPHVALAFVFASATAGPDGARIGPVGAFVVGLMVDVLSLAPLGVCASAYLAFYAIAAREEDVVQQMPLAGRVLVYMPLAAGVTAVHIAAMTLVGSALPATLDIAICVILTVVAYPVLALIRQLLRRPDRRARAIRA